MTLPFTIRGIARWALRDGEALMAYILAMGFLVACSSGWVFGGTWLPVLESALKVCPEGVLFESGRLVAAEPTSKILASNTFFSIAIRTHPGLESASTSDVRVLLDEAQLRIGSLAGFLSIPYPPGFTMHLDSNNLYPWWSSRRFFVCLVGWGCMWAGILACWCMLAAIYAMPFHLLAYLFCRECSSRLAFRMNLMSLIPPALFMTLALVLYGQQRLHLQELLVACVIHIPLAWILALLSLFHLDRRPSRTASRGQDVEPSPNPFGKRPKAAPVSNPTTHSSDGTGID